MKTPGSLLRGFILILILVGCAALGVLLCLPGEASGVLGISPARLTLVLFLGGSTTFLGILGWKIRRSEAAEQAAKHFSAFIQAPGRYRLLTGFCFLALLLSGYSTWFYFRTNNTYYQGILLRLMPLLFYVGAASLKTLFLSRTLRSESQPALLNRRAAWLWTGLFIFQIALGAFILTTRIGLTRDNEVGLGWGDPGVPVLAEQVFLVLLACFILTGIYLFLHQKSLNRLPLDALVFISLWVLAAALWLAQPVLPSYFAPAPRPPNYEFYPYSDAGDYDRAAQLLLAGAGLGGVAKRPLYSLFLAALHTLSGGRFPVSVDLQVIVLAVFPAVLYLLGKRAGSRFAGLLLAGLAIWRECNALALSGETNVSHSRLLMSDLPTALGVALLALAGMAWLRATHKTDLKPLLSGGLLGLLMLVRSQSVLLSLPLLVFIGVQSRGKPRIWLKQALIFSLGLFLAVMPWMLRNYALTGKITFEESGQISALVQRYSLQPSQTAAEGNILGFLRSNPAQVASFVTAHFLHNWVSARFVLPVNFRLVNLVDKSIEIYPYWQKSGEPLDKMWGTCCFLLPYVKEDVPYWQAWGGRILPESFLPLLLGFMLSAAGIVSAWRKAGWAGLLPGGFFIAYAFSCALIRSSGWRYILPVDWVTLFYYALGITAIINGLVHFFFGAVNDQPETTAQKKDLRFGFIRQKWAFSGLGCLILLAGSAIPVAEMLIPPRYPPGSEVQVLESLPASLWSEAGIQKGDLERFLSQGNALAIYGRALYPKIFLPGEDEPWYGNWEGQRTRREKEMDFLVIGSAGSLPVILPLDTGEEVALPQGSDVLVLGKTDDGILTANVVIVLDGEGAHLLPSSYFFGF
jgi:hypothetical protein